MTARRLIPTRLFPGATRRPRPSKHRDRNQHDRPLSRRRRYRPPRGPRTAVVSLPAATATEEQPASGLKTSKTAGCRRDIAGSIKNNELPITTNARIDSDPRVGVLSNVFSNSHTLATAQLVRIGHAAATSDACRALSLKQLLAAWQLHATDAHGVPAIQQLRGLLYG